MHPRKRQAVAAIAAAAALSSIAALSGSADAAPSANALAHRNSTTSPTTGVTSPDLSSTATAQLTQDSKRNGGGTTAAAPTATTAAKAAPAPTSTPTTLVLYDTDGQWGYLGELYAIAADNLAGHFGTVKTEPVGQYTSGQVNGYDAIIYIGSSYHGDSANDPVPGAFYSDVATTNRPVIWMNDNIWNMASSIGAQNFANQYGWDPTQSYFAPGGNVGNITEVDYKSQPLTRKIPAGSDGGVLHPDILGGSYPAVTTLATGQDTSTTPSTPVPWAIRSGNLTYLGEIPFEYVSETDRVIAFEDLLYDALAPNTTARHRAMMRLEDISPASDPNELMTAAKYLAKQGVPYGFNVIPVYTDPNGAENNGVPQTITLSQSPNVVQAIKYMLAHGGTIIDEGYTHQYSNVADPYNGISGDDFEFFLAHVDSANYVRMDGPVSEDSTAWAQGRINAAVAEFQKAGLPVPSLWVTPHYAASDTDYHALAGTFRARYERSIYYAGQLSGASGPLCTHNSWPCNYIGQFFPYPVHDVYGTTVLPENLGDYEPVPLNNNPVRTAADLVHEAQLNLAVRDGFASFFYDPGNPVQPLQDTITGIRNLGYTFISPASVS